MICAKQCLDLGGGAVAEPQPNQLRWMTLQQTQLTEIRVLADHDEAIIFGVVPHFCIQNLVKPKRINMSGIREQIG